MAPGRGSWGVKPPADLQLDNAREYRAAYPLFDARERRLRRQRINWWRVLGLGLMLLSAALVIWLIWWIIGTINGTPPW